MRTDSSVKYIEKNTPSGRVPVCDKTETIKGTMVCSRHYIDVTSSHCFPLRLNVLIDEAEKEGS